MTDVFDISYFNRLTFFRFFFLTINRIFSFNVVFLHLPVTFCESITTKVYNNKVKLKDVAEQRIRKNLIYSLSKLKSLQDTR